MKFTNESRRKQLFPNVSDADWNDWHWQVANRAETLEDLKKYIELTPEEEEGVKACLGTLRMAITPYYLSLIDPNDPHDPVRKQAIPPPRSCISPAPTCWTLCTRIPTPLCPGSPTAILTACCC